MCFFTASTISGWELGTSFESVARAHDGQSVTELCPSDPGVGELLTVIQQSTNKNPLFRSKDILAGKLVVIPFLKRHCFFPPSTTTSHAVSSSFLPLQQILWNKNKKFSVKFCLQVSSLHSVSAIDVCDCQWEEFWLCLRVRETHTEKNREGGRERGGRIGLKWVSEWEREGVLSVSKSYD